MKSKKGISLIVLIITIIVVIILAAVVILTLSKNNPIESAKEARFKEDVRTFQDELALTVSKQYTIAGGHRDQRITTSDFYEIQGYIPRFSEKYRDKFIIQDDELRHTKQLNEKEKEYSQSLSVKEKGELSEQYKQIEYLETSGTQYINTDLNQISKKVQIEVKFAVLRSKDYQNLYCCRNDFINGSKSLFIQYLGGFRNDQNNYQQNINKSLNLNQAYVLETSQTYFKIDNEILYTYPQDSGIYLENRPFILLNAYDPNSLSISPNYGFVGKIYYYRIYDEGKIIRDYIPVLDLNNKPALYDKLEGKFYYNQGNGEDFIAGPEVNE